MRKAKLNPIPVDIALDPMTEGMPLSDRQLWDGIGIDAEELEKEAKGLWRSTCGLTYEWTHNDPHWIFICLRSHDHMGKHKGTTASLTCEWEINRDGTDWDITITPSGDSESANPTD